MKYASPAAPGVRPIASAAHACACAAFVTSTWLQRADPSPSAVSCPRRAIAIVRWLGLMFVVYVAVMGQGLVAGDRAYWRVILPAIVLGDAMHVGASLWRTTLPDFHASSTSIADLVVVCAYLPLRIWLARHPERLDRAPAA